MTTQFVMGINSELNKIQEMGGAVAAIKSGYQVSKIEENAFRIATEIETGKRKIVGMNCWKTEIQEENRNMVEQIESHDLSEKINKYKSQRDTKNVKLNLQLLQQASTSNMPIIPILKNCILVGASIGEMCDVLRISWGVQNQ
jgi:methylmalonyl-CoA mutase N-terminal domain/subunit